MTDTVNTTTTQLPGRRARGIQVPPAGGVHQQETAQHLTRTAKAELGKILRTDPAADLVAFAAQHGVDLPEVEYAAKNILTEFKDTPPAQLSAVEATAPAKKQRKPREKKALGKGKGKKPAPVVQGMDYETHLVGQLALMCPRDMTLAEYVDSLQLKIDAYRAQFETPEE